MNFEERGGREKGQNYLPYHITNLSRKMFIYNFTNGFLIISKNYACLNKCSFLVKSRLFLSIYFADHKEVTVTVIL